MIDKRHKKHHRRRICLFAGYDVNGRVHDYVVYYISQLAIHADVHYLSDCEMDASQLDRLSPYVVSADAYRHGKYDFGTWQELINCLGWDHIAGYDELILCNDSCYGPLFPMDSVFGQMDSRKIDFWAMSESTELLTSHLQSYFLVFRNKILCSDVLQRFFSEVRKQQEFWNYVVKYEIFLTKYLVNAGYNYEPFLKADSAINATTFPTTIVRDFRFPLIKIKCFTSPETNLNESIDDLESLLDMETVYDPALIWTHLASVAPDCKARIMNHLGNAPVIPKPAKPQKLLAHLHLEHPEEAPYFIAKLQAISCDLDLYITSQKLDDLTVAQFKDFDNRTKLIEIPDASNDVLAFLYVIQLVDVLDYDIVLKMNSMGISFNHDQLLGANLYAYGWRNTLLDPLLESKAVFSRHVAEIKNNKNVGMIASARLLSGSIRNTNEESEFLLNAWANSMMLATEPSFAPVVAGRIFLMRSSLFMPLRSLKPGSAQFDVNGRRATDENIQHAFEKIVALLLDHGGVSVCKLDLETVPPPPIVADTQITLATEPLVTPTGVQVENFCESTAVHSRSLLYIQLVYIKIGKRLRLFNKTQYKSIKESIRSRF